MIKTQKIMLHQLIPNWAAGDAGGVWSITILGAVGNKAEGGGVRDSNCAMDGDNVEEIPEYPFSGAAVGPAAQAPKIRRDY